MNLSVDRVSEGFAVCQDLLTEKFFSIPLSDLPKGVKEGDVLTNGAEGIFFINEMETNMRRANMIQLQNRIIDKFLGD